ncbi:NADH:flavin oxidoreductase/NADH oxidase [Mrakia frigida]|uniref:alkene reductase n=1 Tax=Mrakia frigida TaxID=29902 RepID=UPI003FCC0339
MSAAPSSSSRLFQPIQLGNKTVHRIAMAPLTRMRAKDGQVPGDFAAEVSLLRPSKGGFILTEATFISLESGGYPGAPGIWSPEQITGWKEITSRVHAKGGVIYLQMWALGRANQGGHAGVETVSASPLPLAGTTIIPRELTVEDIARYVAAYKQAALNAIEAGFDGVEIHNANGYLLDQFLQTVSNKRTDSYGGSFENRSRFTREVVKAVTEAIGQEKTGIRFSPWSTFQDQQEKNPVETTFGPITKSLVELFPKLAYVHFFRAIVRGIDPSTLPKEDTTVFPDPDASHPTVFLSASGFDRDNAAPHADRTGDVVVFGRYFIANPDLPERIKQGVDFTKYNRDTFYTPGPVGYTDYPTATKVQA